jgi:hypothetical protein
MALVCTEGNLFDVGELAGDLIRSCRNRYAVALYGDM